MNKRGFGEGMSGVRSSARMIWRDMSKFLEWRDISRADPWSMLLSIR